MQTSVVGDGIFNHFHISLSNISSHFLPDGFTEFGVLSMCPCIHISFHFSSFIYKLFYFVTYVILRVFGLLTGYIYSRLVCGINEAFVPVVDFSVFRFVVQLFKTICQSDLEVFYIQI